MDRPLILLVTDSDTGMIVDMEILVKGFNIGIVLCTERLFRDVDFDLLTLAVCYIVNNVS